MSMITGSHTPAGALVAATDLEAVQVGQHDIEHDGVIARAAHHRERLIPATGPVGQDAVEVQAAAQAGIRGSSSTSSTSMADSMIAFR
ncbi:MAG: hypothetical protein ABI611_19845 [Solirubrobacteraceae bacterium]